MRVITIGAATSVFVQGTTMALSQTAFDQTDAATNRNEDLREQIEEDFERDDRRFGNTGRQLGYSGSVALRATASSGNSETADIGIGADFLYFDGTNGYSAEFFYDYAEDSGTRNEESLYYDLEYTRDFSLRAYGFAKVQGTVDEFSAYETDTFVGFGLGYRVYDTPELQWTVQAGPGYRFADLTAVSLNDLDEPAVAGASNLYVELSETAYLTNATDIISSDNDTVIYNELDQAGRFLRMAGDLALKTSLRTEHHTDPRAGFDATDNTYGVSLVYSF